MSETLRQWAELIAQVNGRTTFGQAGVRDPYSPCTAFEPGIPDGECDTDGHYMCDECTEMELCECGLGRPSFCELEPGCLLKMRDKTDDAIEAMTRAGWCFEHGR